MTLDVGNTKSPTTPAIGELNDPVADQILEALDNKGPLDVVELVSIIHELPSVVEVALSRLTQLRWIEVMEEVDDLAVYKLTRPLHPLFYKP